MRIKMGSTTTTATAQAQAVGPVVTCADPDDGPVLAATAVDDETLARMAKALGHPVRLRIIRLLAERHACVTGELVAELPLAQSTISEHLRVLREAGLIRGEIEGPRTSYCLDRAGLAALQAALASL
ncbi:MAG: ArsR/SmtB family transcription factor [Solirubrobacteraceae bacterium]